MSDINVTGVANSYAAYQTTTSTDTEEAKVASKGEEVANTKPAEDAGVVFEKSEEVKPATYSINKMSQEERTKLVNQLKADQEARVKQLEDIVSKMLTGQANTYGKANDIWSILRSGNFTVDAATKEQAQKDIEEDGYYGVKQTAQRLFDFASALAGDDEKQMQKMQKAVEKGYKEAEKLWGGELPQISKDTLDATNKLFEDYFNAKKNETVITE